jgi:hypothetical protein
VDLSVAGVGEQAHPVGLRAVGGPHLAAVDHPVAAVAARRGLDRGDVRAGAHLGDAEAGDVLAADRGRKELAAQLVRAVAGEGRGRHRDLHADAHRHRAAVHAAELLGADHGVGEVETRAAEFHRLVDPQQARLAELGKQLVRRKDALALPLVDERVDLAVDQRLPGAAELFVLTSELHG